MVYYCSVKGCKNNSKMKKKDPNIILSFHAFPVKEATKQKWLHAIGRPSWKPPSFARICSAHFDFDQISHEGCRMRMVDDAVPVHGLPPNSNFEASNVEVCRMCLATDLKMFSLKERLLNTCLQSLVGLKENCSIEGLPQFVCYQCSARLVNCYNLIERCTVAQTVLLDLFIKNGQVTKSLVQKQDRKALGLESSLKCFITTNLREYTLKENGDYKINKMDASKNASEDLNRQLKLDLIISERDGYDEKVLTRLTKACDNLKNTKDKIATNTAAIIHPRSLDHKLDLNFEIPPTPHNIRKRSKNSIELGVSIFDESNDSLDLKIEPHLDIQLNKKENDEERVERKIKKSDDGEERYPCQDCDLDFVSEEARRVHLLTSKQHRKKPDLCDPMPVNPVKTCSKCNTLFPSTKELITHTRSEHPRLKRTSRNNGYPCKCEHCEEMLESRWQHWLHVRRQHPDKKHSYRAEHNFVCQRCGKQFQNSTKLHMHELHHGPAALRCAVCARAFHDKYALARHARAHVPLPLPHPLACGLCARPFRAKHNLLRHQRVHTGETPYGCNLCGKRFKHSTSQRHHVRSVHCNLPAPKRNKHAVKVNSN